MALTGWGLNCCQGGHFLPRKGQNRGNPRVDWRRRSRRQSSLGLTDHSKKQPRKRVARSKKGNKEEQCLCFLHPRHPLSAIGSHYPFKLLVEIKASVMFALILNIPFHTPKVSVCESSGKIFASPTTEFCKMRIIPHPDIGAALELSHQVGQSYRGV